MDEVRLIVPEPWHADLLVDLMAEKDLAAFRALGAGDPASVVRGGIARSCDGWCAMAGEEPLCIGGIVPASIIGDQGYPWMVSQPALDRHKKALLRLSRARLAELRRRYVLLTNSVSCDYPKSLRWLAWLGFEIGPLDHLSSGAAVRRITLIS